MDQNDLGLEEVCAAIGYELTRLLAAWFSNGYLYVPSQFRMDHPLVNLIGEKPLRKLVDLHRGERVWVPASSADATHRRDRAVAEMIAGGASVEAIAGFLELSVSRVESVRRELELRGVLAYAGGYRRRARGRPVEGTRPAPDITVR